MAEPANDSTTLKTFAVTWEKVVIGSEIISAENEECARRQCEQLNRDGRLTYTYTNFGVIETEDIDPPLTGDGS